MSRNSKWLLLILAAAFLGRIIGIMYGLPLWLIHDEPAFVFGALKMLELKTLLPVLHSSAFAQALYYPPYLSFLYLPFFIIAIGVKYLLFAGSFSDFKNFLILDPSTFFIIARIVSALLGTLTVYLLYKVAKNIFHKERVALFSCLALALSYIHTDFSHWGRHWVPVTFIFTAILFALSNKSWSHKKRYIVSAVLAGLGVGVNFQMGIAVVMIGIWYFVVDGKNLRDAFRDKIIWLSGSIFVALFVVAYVIYPGGFVLSGADVAGGWRSASDFLNSLYFFPRILLSADPGIFALFIPGLAYLYKFNKRIFWAFGLFALAYICIFYSLLFYVDRYIIMLLPLVAIIAGLFANKMSEYKLGNLALVLVLLWQGGQIVKLDYLLVKNDTRTEAIEWVEKNLPENSKIVIYGDMMRARPNKASILDQEKIDPDSLRSGDRAALDLSHLDTKERVSFLNLSEAGKTQLKTATSSSIISEYEYAIVEPSLLKEKGLEGVFKGIVIKPFAGYSKEDGDLVNWFGGGLHARETVPAFNRSIGQIFRTNNLGPYLELREIN